MTVSLIYSSKWWIQWPMRSSSIKYTLGSYSRLPLSTTSSTVWSCGSARSRISARALNPFTGALKGRLNRGTAHWPLNPSFSGIKKANCQMHWWVIGKWKYKNVEFCKECNVSFCTDKCYELFHTCWDIESEKENLRLAFKKNSSEDTAVD